MEDDLALAHGLTAMVEHHGLATFHAETVPQAIEVGRRVRPDLLVLDLLLADGDGGLVVACFRGDDHRAALPLVVLTSTDIGHAAPAQLKLGATEGFVKRRMTVSEFEGPVAGLVDRLVGDKLRATAQA